MKLQLVRLKPRMAAVVRGRNMDDPKKRKATLKFEGRRAEAKRVWANAAEPAGWSSAKGVSTIYTA